MVESCCTDIISVINFSGNACATMIISHFKFVKMWEVRWPHG